MIEDLNKIRIIETSMDETPEDFWKKMHSYLKEDLFALCALDMAYTDLYAQKERSYMTIELYYREQSINRLHNRDCSI
jgi:uncharacterized protein (DUF111 family)